jgi:hypothetical protein
MLIATDEDFNNRILRGVFQRLPHLNNLRAQDAGLSGVARAVLLCAMVTD